MLLPSSLFLSFAMRTDRSLTARLDEHRLSKNTIGPVCAFGEQRETDSPRRRPWCGRAEARSKKTPSCVHSALLSSHLLLESRGTVWAAETVGLPADHLGHRGTARHEDPAHRILHHLILALWKTSGLLGSEFAKGATQKVIEDDEQDENEDYSIHSG
jgi:hypothetical protein